MVFFNTRHAEFQKHLSLAKTIAKQYNTIEKLTFVWIDGLEFEEFVKNFGFSLEDLPRWGIINVQTKGEYIFDPKLPLTSNNLKQFIDDYVSGTLRPRLKSAEPPSPNDGPVRVVTASTFKSEVIDSDANVLLEFWAPWCGVCKKLAPVYVQVGLEFKGNPNIVIANFDAQANDADPSFNITGFPTMIFFPKGKKNQYITYTGEGDVNKIVSFVKTNALG